MSWEENKEFNESKPQYQPDPPEPYSLWKKTWKYVAVGVVCFLFGLSITTCRANSIAERNRDLSAENRKLKKAIENTPAETVLVPYTVPVPVATASIQPSKEAAPVTDAPAAEPSSTGTYENNDYYDIVETALIDRSIPYTTVIHKVLAKKNATISSNLIAYDADGNVIDKSSDTIILTEGQYNFFRYTFSDDVSNANIQASIQAKKAPFVDAMRNGVEMLQYNRNGKELYITFQQNIDDLKFSRYKLIFYQDDKIVETEEGTFNFNAENLNGKGTTDVAEIGIYGFDYDRFEYIYQPSEI